MINTNERKPNAVDVLNNRLTELMAKMKLDSWTQFTQVVDVTASMAAALSTGRPELLAAMPVPKVSELSDEDVVALWHLIQVLVETNNALQQHAAEVAKQVGIWTQGFAQLEAVGWRIERFANFKRTDEGEEG